MHSGASIFCLRCGHENPAQNRFCGMCGGELVRPHSSDAGPAADAAPTIEEQSPHHFAAPFEHYGSGSSYLYDDEESHSHWKLVLLAAVIAIAGFVIAYQWGKPNFDTSRVLDLLDRLDNRKQAEGSKPGGAGENKPADSSGPSAPTPSAASPPVSGNAPAAASQPQPAPSAPPPNTAESTPAPGSGGVGGRAAGRGPTEQDLAPGVVPPPAPQPGTAPPSANSAAAEPGEGSASPDSDEEDASAEDSAKLSPPPPSAPAARAGRAREEAEPDDRKQRAGDDLLVDTAQNYLYGRGVPRDCDRAVSYLRRAAQTSVRAKTQLGAMYATGQCVPQDRPTAYHWLALAYRGDPRNSYLERDLQMLWGQMTGEERQRATRMSR